MVTSDTSQEYAYINDASSLDHSEYPAAITNIQLDFRFLIAVDVEGFSKRSTREQAQTQFDLDRALYLAAQRAGLDRGSWHRQQAGDGELAVLPPNANPFKVLAKFPRELAHVLAGINSEDRGGSRVRVRIAIHHGTLAPGCFGPVGKAPIIVSRLLDSDVLRRELVERADEDVVLIISSSLYSDVIEAELGGLFPGDFKIVEIRAKSVVIPAYILQIRLENFPTDSGGKV